MNNGLRTYKKQDICVCIFIHFCTYKERWILYIFIPFWHAQRKYRIPICINQGSPEEQSQWEIYIDVWRFIMRN